MMILECVLIAPDVISFASREPGQGFLAVRPAPGEHWCVEVGKWYHLAMTETPAPIREAAHD